MSELSTSICCCAVNSVVSSITVTSITSSNEVEITRTIAESVLCTSVILISVIILVVGPTGTMLISSGKGRK